MDDTTPPPDVSSNKLQKSDWFFIWGMAAVNVLSILCMVGNFIKPGSIPAEPIWAVGAVVGVHKVSSDKFNV